MASRKTAGSSAGENRNWPGREAATPVTEIDKAKAAVQALAEMSQMGQAAGQQVDWSTNVET